MTQRLPVILIILLIPGCRPPIPADVGYAPISTVELPTSRYSVELFGPELDGEYCYMIFNASGECYSLGDIEVDESADPTLQTVSPQVYRITWGSGSNAPYVVIDVGRRLILEDSNPDSASNRPF